MAPKLIRFALIVPLVLATLLCMPSVRAFATDGSIGGASLPALDTFANAVNNGQPGELRGVYVPNVLADSVVQQPANEGNFVSIQANMLTQFGAASTLGSTGLLAHNFLAGATFTQMHYGHAIYLIYGDGRRVAYTVTHIQQYQALEPESPYSNFINLDTGSAMTSGAVFTAAYGHRGAVIFQTCISENGDASWGRLFVIAELYGAPMNAK